MSTGHLIQTTLEILVAVALLIGFIYEPVVAEWEDRQKEKILRAFKKRKEYRK